MNPAPAQDIRTGDVTSHSAVRSTSSGTIETVTSRNALKIAAAGIIAAVALSACSTSVSGQPVADPATSSATVAGAESAGTSAEAESNWGDVPTVQGARDARGYRFGAPATGIMLWQSGEGCTAGPVVAPAAASRQRGLLTAGHCDITQGNPVTSYTTSDHSASAQAGNYTGTKDTGDIDATVVWGPTAPATVGGQYRVAGVLTGDAVRELVGDDVTVCVDGAVLGLRCGDLVDADADLITARIPTDHGDSGAAMFLVDKATQATTLIGIVKGSSSGFSYATHLDPTLRALGSKVVTDPAVAVNPGSDPRYSDAAVIAQ